MESKNELKEIDIKTRVCYYFDDTNKHININFCNILLGKKLYKNTLVYYMSYKTSAGPKPLRISFAIRDRFIRVCGGEFKHFVLFDYEL